MVFFKKFNYFYDRPIFLVGQYEFRFKFQFFVDPAFNIENNPIRCIFFWKIWSRKTSLSEQIFDLDLLKFFSGPKRQVVPVFSVKVIESHIILELWMGFKTEKQPIAHVCSDKNILKRRTNIPFALRELHDPVYVCEYLGHVLESRRKLFRSSWSLPLHSQNPFFFRSSWGLSEYCNKLKKSVLIMQR